MKNIVAVLIALVLISMPVLAGDVFDQVDRTLRVLRRS